MLMNTFLKVTMPSFSTAVIVRWRERFGEQVPAGTPHWKKQTTWAFLEDTLAIDTKHLNQFLGNILLMTMVTTVSH